MKISASIYSDKTRPLLEVINDLVEHQVDILHVDCNDDISVFDDIVAIRSFCDLPIDLHIITPKPSKFYPLLIKHPVEYVTFQYENLSEPLTIPQAITAKLGLAIITPTPITVFEQYSEFDFILIMATIPGQSGGVFDKTNFDKIRQFRTKFPSKSIHVDGGVNGEVSFILRNMGVSSSVSGSYLFKGPSVGHQLMNLTKRNIESVYVVSDFMTPISETPIVYQDALTVQNVLETIDYGKVGFCIVTDKTQNLLGLISNADVRKSLLRHISDLNNISCVEMINTSPIVVKDTATVIEMLQIVKNSRFTVSYLPVISEDGKAVGMVNFTNLIKSER